MRREMMRLIIKNYGAFAASDTCVDKFALSFKRTVKELVSK